MQQAPHYHIAYLKKHTNYLDTTGGGVVQVRNPLNSTL